MRIGVSFIVLLSRADGLDDGAFRKRSTFISNHFAGKENVSQWNVSYRRLRFLWSDFSAAPTTLG